MEEVHRIGIFEGKEGHLYGTLVSRSCVYLPYMLKPKKYGSGWFKRFDILVFVAFFGQFLKTFLNWKVKSLKILKIFEFFFFHMVDTKKLGVFLKFHPNPSSGSKVTAK